MGGGFQTSFQCPVSSVQLRDELDLSLAVSPRRPIAASSFPPLSFSPFEILPHTVAYPAGGIYIMATPAPSLPVLRFVGLLAGNEAELAAARTELVHNYGEIDDESSVIPFSFTQYYDEEMGPNLLRQWVRFKTPSAADQLTQCKLETNATEVLLAKQFPRGVARPVNIDPGYVHRYKVILATTKDHAHRIYLHHGIYAEVTLHWSQNLWTPWPWTYADYKTETAQVFFTKARTAYLQQLQVLTAGK